MGSEVLALIFVMVDTALLMFLSVYFVSFLKLASIYIGSISHGKFIFDDEK